MKDDPFEEIRRTFKDLGNLFVGEESPEEDVHHGPHPLLDAAKAYIDITHEYDVYCEKKGVYDAARLGNIAFTRRTETPTFQRLEAIAAKASRDLKKSGFIRQDAVTDLIEAALKIKKITTDPRAVVFVAAEKNYKDLGHHFKGPNTGYALSALINLSEKYAAEAVRPDGKASAAKNRYNP